jgi:cystathionine beta-lyase
MFGAAGAGFQRFNIACPRAILEEAMERLEKACRSRT